ncbi:hypothetical protein CQ047_12135 [Microbacterium sp. MYb72]|uniref:hypothetical protein n=1 Tax=Microbacterium sp. MYb72 TaxID=1848693 RepID=UPI000CFD88F9|nr:hypothetical protein [Microbacterium sp. MYb72]PRB08622.1 hypothetical protein CQ047_12135 [Microbacterium sp. MYb72]
MADPTPAPGGDLGPILERFRRLERDVADLKTATGTQRALAVRRLPFQDFRVGQTAGIGLSAGWNTYATITLAVPEDRTRLQVLGIGTAAVLDQTSGGLTTSYGRILIDGSASREFPAAKDAGATLVNNVITATSAAVIDVTGKASVTVAFQLQPLNPAAYPAHAQNFAQLAVIGSFTIA